MSSPAALLSELQVERISVVRDPSLPGLELLKAENSVREWKIFNTVHSINISDSWLGNVEYRGRVSQVTPGNVFCTEPGEAHSTSRPAAPGSLRVLTMEEAPLRKQLEELNVHTRHIHFAETVTCKAALQLRRLMSSFGAVGTSSLEIQSAFVDLVTVIAHQLLTDRPTRPAAVDDSSVLADQMRDLLHARVQEGASLSLDELAAAADLDRFRALRVFKRRHGMPPHTYELCLRLSRARDLLKAGMSVAATAVECGFADQSHMTRHFRRSFGMTPAKYAPAVRSANFR